MIQVKLDNKRALAKMKKVQRNVKKTKPILEEIAKKEIKDAQTRVRTSKKDPDGNRWKDWANATHTQRIKDGTASRGLLYKSGLLLESFWKKVTNKKITIGNDAPYAKYHQYGEGVPRREFLGWGKQNKKTIQGMVLKYFRKVIR